tara:strand:- start:409 stop:2244 length:1836 start_codon:yes stop_codon:yes gene_type:complete
MAQTSKHENKFLKNSRIKVSELLSDTKTYVKRIYGRAGTLFTSASPFGQILSVLHELTGFVFYYIEQATQEQNILTAQHAESIYGLSRLSGHDPFRGTSASGEIKIRLNTIAPDEIKGDAINIPANAIIKSTENSLEYILRTSGEKFRFQKSSVDFIYIPVIQGKIESQVVTATGEKFQSFNIITNGNTDHSNVKVSVNGTSWNQFDSLYDMQTTTKGFIIKTGITGGLDIYFGNGSFGLVPANGNSISIEYIKTDGVKGNLTGANDLTFEFDTEGFDSLGNTYNLNELMEGSFTKEPIMGTNPESIELTKLIAPMQSHSFVLATPDNYESFLAKYGMFSYLDAYNTTNDGYLDDDNIIYLFMLPDVSRKITDNKDYFGFEEEEFFFSEEETNALLRVLEESGRQMVTTEVKIVEPIPAYFRMDVKIRYFEGYEKTNIFENVRAKISDYLLAITRRDRLPKSDIIAILETVEGIDSVNVVFSSKVEEDARRLGYYSMTTTTVTPTTPTLSDIGNGKSKFVFFKKTVTKSNKTFTAGEALPENVINLDSFGDVLLEKEEVALFKGGWKDRDGITVAAGAAIGEMAALSVYFEEPAIPQTIFTRVQSKHRKAL